jgi:hypothetical protein
MSVKEKREKRKEKKSNQNKPMADNTISQALTVRAGRSPSPTSYEIAFASVNCTD